MQTTYCIAASFSKWSLSNKVLTDHVPVKNQFLILSKFIHCCKFNFSETNNTLCDFWWKMLWFLLALITTLNNNLSLPAVYFVVSSIFLNNIFILLLTEFFKFWTLSICFWSWKNALIPCTVFSYFTNSAVL